MPDHVDRRDRQPFPVDRRLAGQPDPTPGSGQGLHRPVESERSQTRLFTRSRAETGTAKQPTRLIRTEFTLINSNHLGVGSAFLFPCTWLPDSPTAVETV